MKWIRVRNEETPWLPTFICPMCGGEHGVFQEDDHCEHCGQAMEEEWEDA